MEKSNGTVCYDADYTPYGQEIPHTNSCGVTYNYKFTGYERDAETGLDYAFARYYSSRLGRFLSPDPLAGDASDAQSLNRYAYVENDPRNLIDPLGMQECPNGAVFVPGTGCAVQGGQVWVKTGSQPLPPPPACYFEGLCDEWGYPYGAEGGGIGGPNGGGSNQQKEKCGTSGFGGGIGITGGGNGDAGLAVTGATASGAVGGGLFYDSKTGFSDGLLATGTTLANFFRHVASKPSQIVNGGKAQPVVLGAYAGATASVFFTNARSVRQLAGPFKTWTLNVGLGPYKFSMQYASAGSVKVLTIGPPYAGASIGASVSKTVTNTKTQDRGCIP